MNMTFHTCIRLLLGAAAISLSCDLAAADVVPVKWDATGAFAHEAQVAAGKFVEVCEKLPLGAKVDWRFQATAPLNFNVHFHEGKDVQFPEKRDQVAVADGALDVKAAQDYCWMWTNAGTTSIRLKLQLKRS